MHAKTHREPSLCAARSYSLVLSGDLEHQRRPPYGWRGSFRVLCWRGGNCPVPRIVGV